MSRPTRSASIPFGPRSSSSMSPSRNIESLISIPFAPPSRPRIASVHVPQRASTVDDHRGLGVSYGTRGSSSSSTAVMHSPTRPTARSMTLGSSSGRGPIRSPPTYEPRVVRGGGEGSHSVDLPSTSPSRMRRTSGTNMRGTSLSRPVSGYTSSITTPPPAAFPRPSYLDYSALRHMLRTDAPPTLPPSRKTEPPTRESHPPILDSDEESNVSPPREFPSTPLPTLSQDRILRLPTRWSDQCRHNLLSVSADGRDLTYHGASCSGDKDAAAARTDQSIPPACGIYYYETEIISKGQKGHISIGFAGPEVKLSRLPGWEKDSWGYHGDDGCSFAAEKTGTKYGPTFGTGDIIGCGVDLTTHRAFFTRNGILIGPVFDDIGKNVDLYPSIGMRHSGEAVRVNFGHEPFRFDIDFYVLQQRNTVWSRISQRQPDASLLRVCGINSDAVPSESKETLSNEQTREAINKLVFSYLEHHGYAKTLKAFAKQREIETRFPQIPNAATTLSSEDNDVDMSAPQDEEDAELERRTKIVNAVILGDVDTAIEDTKAYHPTVLQAEDGLMFMKLRCQKFVEMMLEAGELKKMKSPGPETAAGANTTTSHDEGVIENMDAVYTDGMDVDDEGAVLPSHSTTTNGFGSSVIPAHLARHRSSVTTPDVVGMLGSSHSQHDSGLQKAIAYGQMLSNEYKDDARPEVEQIFKRTFSILAFEDPMSGSGGVAEVVSQSAKVALANELNRAILKSQGRPATPLLETLYRHTAVVVSQLGLMGVGGAAFTDMHREFLEA